MNISARTFLIVTIFTVTSPAKAQVEVELIPGLPGPYEGGESLTVDVWLHSEVSFDAHLHVVQLDFSDSDGAPVLDPTFNFDLSSSGAPQDFAVQEELPVPWTANWFEYYCPTCRLQLPTGGSLHIGNIGIKLPTERGTYRLDTLNSDDPIADHGARIIVGGSLEWRAFDGEITGGTLDFVVGPGPIPAVSTWGLMVLLLLMLVSGTIVILRAAPRDRVGGYG